MLPLFERALRQIVSEAQTLRLQFSEQSGEPRQFVGEPTAWPLPIIDVSAETDPRAAAETWMQADLARPIDPVVGPLFGFALFKVSAKRFFWYARYHHIVLDAFGMWLIARRVAEVYSGLCAGGSPQGEAFGSLSSLLMKTRRIERRVSSLRTGIIGARLWRAAGGRQPDAQRPPVHQVGRFLRATAYVPGSVRLRCARWRPQPDEARSRHDGGDSGVPASLVRY